MPFASRSKSRKLSAYKKKTLGSGFFEPLEQRSLLSVNPLGPELRVNEATLGNQANLESTAKTVAVDADGDFVVTWSDYFTGGVKARRFNDDGTPTGNEVVVTGSSLARHASVATDALGNFVVTWTNIGGLDGDGAGVFARKFNAAGVPQTGVFRVNTTTAGNQQLPAIAMEENGDFVIAWESVVSTGSFPSQQTEIDVFARRYSAAAVPQGNEFRVNTSDTGDQRTPAVAVDADGDFVVAWMRNELFGSTDKIFAQRYNSSGVRQAGEFQVNLNTPNDVRMPGVAMDAQGNFVVSWIGAAVNVQRYNQFGDRLGPSIQVNTDLSETPQQASVAMDADGDFVVAWETEGRPNQIGYGIFAQGFSSTGVRTGEAQHVNQFANGRQRQASAAINPDGDLVVSWSSLGQDGSGYGIYARRFQPVPITGPTADIVDVIPSPRNTPVASVEIVFSEPVFGFDLSDLVLDKSNDGLGNLLTGAQTLTTSDNQTFTLNNLALATGTDGTYTLSLNASNSFITDTLGNPLTTDAVEVWIQTGVIVDNLPPTVDVIDVTPDPRTTPVNSINIQFSEPVTGFDLSDLILDRVGSGSGNLLPGNASLTTTDNVNYTLGGLGSVTGTNGQYVLSLLANGRGIADLAGNLLQIGATESWSKTSGGGDVTRPSVDIVNVVPDPINQPVAFLDIVFSEPVVGFGLNDLSLQKSGDGLGNLLTGSESLTTLDNRTFRLSGISSLTATNGLYTLQLNAATSGITDFAGNSLLTSAIESWTQTGIGQGDTTPPTADIVDVAPDPTNIQVTSLTIDFSELVTGFNLSDLRLEKAGDGQGNLLTGNETLSTSDNRRFVLSGISGITNSNGQFTLSLLAANSGIQDSAGNAMLANAFETWTQQNIGSVDTTPPTVDIVDISPDPTNFPVTSIEIVFSEPVTGFTVSDLFLDKALDNRGNLLTGTESLTTSDNIRFTLSGLAPLTRTNGQFFLSLRAAGSGITDAAGNPLGNNASEEWLQQNIQDDNQPPTVDIVDVFPDPTTQPVTSLQIVFSEPVTGFGISDLVLDKANDNQGNLLTNAQSLTTTDNQVYTLSGLQPLTVGNGQYTLSLIAGGSGITDLFGNVLQTSAIESWTQSGGGGGDTISPTVDIVDVVPDPIGVSVTSLQIAFSEPILGFSLSDLRLTRTGSPSLNLLTGNETLSTLDNRLFTLSGIGPLTSTDDLYSLSLIASGSGIVDFAGNPLLSSAFESWTQQGLGGGGDTTPPSVDIVNVTPDPRSTPVTSMQIVFSEPVVGFNLTDLGLFRVSDSTPNLLTGNETLSTFDNRTFTLSGLAPITDADGQYNLTLFAFGSGITDFAGNPLSNSANEVWNQTGIINPNNPTADIIDVTPDPINARITSLQIVFSEPVLGFNLNDLILDKTNDGLGNLLTGNESLTTTDNVVFTLSGIDALTAGDGQYRLTVRAANSGITDLGGNPLLSDAVETWTQQGLPGDTISPTVNIVDVFPDPRNTSVSSIQIVFSEPVTGFDVSDLFLDRVFDNATNLLTGNETLTTTDNRTFTLSGLQAATATDGQYILSLIGQGSGIRDLAGNALTTNAFDNWTQVGLGGGGDTTPPTVDIVDVTPDPRTTPVSSMTIVFNEQVTGFGIDDLILDNINDTKGNLLTGLENLTTSDNRTFILSGLSGLTNANGQYSLSLAAANSGIRDLAGNLLQIGATESWTRSGSTGDTTPPTADIVDVVPNPINVSVNSLEIRFSETVVGFNLADLRLTRSGSSSINLLTGSETLTTNDNRTYFLSGLSPVTNVDAQYRLTLTASGSGITDLAGNNLLGNALEVWTQTNLGGGSSPTVDIVDIVPDPINTPVTTLQIVFNEPVTGFDLGDLVLDKSNDAQGNLLTNQQTLVSSDNQTFFLNNLSPLTGTDGQYTLSLVASGSGITDFFGNPLLTGAFEVWTQSGVGNDQTPPSVNIVDVFPDPRNTAVFSIQIEFSEIVTGFELADLSLTRTGSGFNLLTNSQTLSSADGKTYTLGNLQGVTNVDGTYVLSLVSNGSGIRDLAGNDLANSASDVWTQSGVTGDTTPPVADIVDVVPDPTTSRISSLQIVFSEQVFGFDILDLELSRLTQGNANLLTGSESLTTTDNRTYLLSGLSGLTQLDGQYRLTVRASGSGIVDAAGNAMITNATEIWTQTGGSGGGDTTPPTVDIVDVFPDPRNTAVTSLDIVFSEPVLNFDLTDLSLIRITTSAANLLTGNEVLTTTDSQTFTLSGISPLTNIDGQYLLSLNSSGSGIVDLSGNALATGASEAWTQTGVSPGDTTPPSVDIIDVFPDPINTAVTTLTIVFSEPVSGFGLDDLVLDKANDGAGNLLTGSETLQTGDNRTFTLSGLGNLTNSDGQFTLTLNRAGAGITDLAGNALSNSAVEVWTQTGVGQGGSPTADIVDVTPDPTNTAVNTIEIVFSEPVTGFDLGDLVLDLANDNAGNLLTGQQLLTTTDNIRYRLTGLSSVTASVGQYTLTLAATGTGIRDLSGNPLANTAVETWTRQSSGGDTSPPTVDIVNVTPDPISTAVSSIVIVFTEPVFGFDISDLSLSRVLEGPTNILTNQQILSTTNNQTFTLSGLATITDVDGPYFLSLKSRNSGIVDAAGNALITGADEIWSKVGSLATSIATTVPASPEASREAGDFNGDGASDLRDFIFAKDRLQTMVAIPAAAQEAAMVEEMPAAAPTARDAAMGTLYEDDGKPVMEAEEDGLESALLAVAITRESSHVVDTSLKTSAMKSQDAMPTSGAMASAKSPEQDDLWAAWDEDFGV